MSKAVTDEKHVADIRRRVAIVAAAMLSDEMPFLEGAIELDALRHNAYVTEDDQDFLVFVAITSETDHLPLGAARVRWSAEALTKHQPEIESATAWARQIGIRACESLVQRFGE
ncbi:MAG: DUF2489 domain-containing protein [Burkholderiales bacterium]|nr:DUF2489 domain-containing protein [Burkholderiales bacterium]